jgi:hypothetical protein
MASFDCIAVNKREKPYHFQSLWSEFKRRTNDWMEQGVTSLLFIFKK